MTDLYIETPTRADYDALMLLAEAAGYMWINDCKPTEWNDHWGDDGWLYEKDGTVIELDGNYLYHDSVEHVTSEEHKIETIPNLANIKAIWKVSRENRNAFTMKHRLPPHYKSVRKLYVICDEYSGAYTTKENEIYKALAVEYKPKESEDIMPEKVKLPKFMCEWLSDIALMEDYPLEAILESEKLRYGNREVLMWSTGNTANQWKLIDALRYGYEAEPEPLYYVIMPIDRTHCFLNQNEDDGEVFFDEKDAVMRIKVKFTIPEILAIDPRYKAFAVPVEEVDGNE